LSVRDQTGVDPGPEVLEIPSEPSATEDTRPEWLDPKFESPEDQAKAYAEAQREMSRAQAAERQAQQQLEQWAVQQQYEPEPQQTQQQTQYPDGSLLQIYEEAVENGDAKTQFGIYTLLAQQAADLKFAEAQKALAPNPQDQQQNAQMFAVLAEQQAAARLGEEWETLKPAIGDILTEHPHLLPNNGDLAQTVNALGLVAEMAKARTGATAQAAAQDAGRQQKLMAQGLSGGAGRPDTQQIAVADHLADLMKKVR